MLLCFTNAAFSLLLSPANKKPFPAVVNRFGAQAIVQMPNLLAHVSIPPFQSEDKRIHQASDRARYERIIVCRDGEYMQYAHVQY